MTIFKAGDKVQFDPLVNSLKKNHGIIFTVTEVDRTGCLVYLDPEPPEGGNGFFPNRLIHETVNLPEEKCHYGTIRVGVTKLLKTRYGIIDLDSEYKIEAPQPVEKKVIPFGEETFEDLRRGVNNMWNSWGWR